MYIYICIYTCIYIYIYIYICIHIYIYGNCLISYRSLPSFIITHHHNQDSFSSSGSSILVQIHKVWSKCGTGRSPSPLDQSDQLGKFNAYAPPYVSGKQKLTKKLYYTLCEWHCLFLERNLCAQIISHKTSRDWHIQP